MGFWDAVAGAAKSAGSALEEKFQQQQFEMWKKFSNLSQDRLLDTFEQNESSAIRSMILMALAHQGYASKAKDLMRKFEGLDSNLTFRRKKLATEDNRYAEEMRRAIDTLLKSSYY